MITDSLGAVSFGLFIVALLGTLALGASYVLALLLKKADWARWILRIEVAGLGLYLVLYLFSSLTSHTQELPVGQEKHICEVDCHLAYAVSSVHTAKQWNGATAQGTFYIVTVRVRFDSNTIASWRPRDLSLSPNGRSVALIDGQEATLKKFFRDGGLIRLEPANAAMTPITVAAERVRVQGVVIGLMRRYV